MNHPRKRWISALLVITFLASAASGVEPDPFQPSELQSRIFSQEPKDGFSKKLRAAIEVCEALVAKLDMSDPLVKKKMPRMREKIGWLYEEYNKVRPRDYRRPNQPFDKALQWIAAYDIQRALKLLAEKKDPEAVRRGKQPTGAYLDINSREGFLASWDLFIPKDYDPRKSYPMIICFQTSMRPARCSEAGYFLVQAFQTGPPASSIHLGYMMNHMVHETSADFNIDRDRVYLTGFSTGGATAFAFAYRYTDVVAGVAPVCPAAEWRDGGTRHAHNVATCVMYGKRDGWNKKGSGPILQRLRASGHPKWEEFPYDAGHDPAPVLVNDTSHIFEFFGKHKRDRYPKKVWKWIEHKRYASAYWLVGKLRQDGKCQGGIVAEIKDGNVIELKTTAGIAAVALYLNDKLVDVNKPIRVTVNGEEKYAGPVKPELYVEILKDHKPYWQDKAPTRLNPYWIKGRKWPGPGQPLAPWMKAE